MKFYHRTTRVGARGILREGFRDGRGGSGFVDPVVGVWLSNKPLTVNEGASGSVVLSLKIPVAAVRAYEVIEEGKPYREWIVPADVVNRYRPVVVEELDPILAVACVCGWSRNFPTGAGLDYVVGRHRATGPEHIVTVEGLEILPGEEVEPTGQTR